MITRQFLLEYVVFFLCVVVFTSTPLRANSQDPKCPLSNEGTKTLIMLGGVEIMLRTADNPEATMRMLLKHPSKDVRLEAMSYIPRLRSAQAAEELVLKYRAEIELQLSDKDDDSKALAATLLSYLGPKAKASVPKLEKLLDSTSEVVRSKVLGALIRIEGKLSSATRERINVCEAQQTESFCIEIIDALKWARQGEVPEILWMMFNQSKSELIRERTITGIGNCGKQSLGFCDRLVSLLFDPKIGDRIRDSAAYSLGRVAGSGEPEVNALIAAMLRDRSVSVRRRACESLGNFPGFMRKVRPAIELYRVQDGDDQSNKRIADVTLERLDQAQRKIHK